MVKKDGIIIIAALVLLIAGLGFIVWRFVGSSHESILSVQEKQAVKIQPKTYPGKKILYVDSYHQGYPWSNGIERGIVNRLKDTGIDLQIHRMDTKRNHQEKFKKNAALAAKKKIASFKPDVIIASDDNAAKYLIVPYYRNTDLPEVFCGINWEIDKYGFPCKNITGMIEVSLIRQLVKHIRKYAAGPRIAILAADTLSERKNVEAFKKYEDLDLSAEIYVKDFVTWKKQFKALQDKADILLLFNFAGIDNWNVKEAEDFVISNTRIPTGGLDEWMGPYVLLAVSKEAEEQGDWSAEAALKILDGKSPADIPVVKNRKGKLVINLKIARILDIVFNPSLLKNADLFNKRVETEKK